MCTLGGARIGVWTWWSNDRVKPLEEVMAEFKATGSYRANGVWRPVVTFSRLFGATGGLSRFGAIAASYAEPIWIIPCLVGSQCRRG